MPDTQRQKDDVNNSNSHQQNNVLHVRTASVQLHSQTNDEGDDCKSIPTSSDRSDDEFDPDDFLPSTTESDTESGSESSSEEEDDDVEELTIKIDIEKLLNDNEANKRLLEELHVRLADNTVVLNQHMKLLGNYRELVTSLFGLIRHFCSETLQFTRQLSEMARIVSLDDDMLNIDDSDL